MYVVFTCAECGSKVDNSLEQCPTCGAELPEYTIERDYDVEIGKELYELEHPIKTRLWKLVRPYLIHLLDVAEQDAALEESVKQKTKAIREQKGRVAAIWYKMMRKIWMIVAAILYIFWLILAYMPAEYIENETTGYILWGVLSLIPLYSVSVWLLVQEDKRDISTKQKIASVALGAFNKLLFYILLLFASIWVSRVVMDFIFPE